MTPGTLGQFEIRADNELIATRGGNWFTRRFGAGYPDMNQIVDLLEQRMAR